MSSDLSNDNYSEPTKVLGSKNMEKARKEALAMSLNYVRRSSISPDGDDYSAALMDALNDSENNESVFQNVPRRDAIDYSLAEAENEKAIAEKVNSFMSGSSEVNGIENNIVSESSVNTNPLINSSASSADLAEDFESTMYRPGQSTVKSDKGTEKESLYKRQKRVNRNRRILIFGIIAFIVIIALIVVFAIRSSEIKKDSSMETEAETEPETLPVLDDIITVNIEDGGEYVLPLRIEVVSSQGNKIYYTVDGSEATTASDKYSGGIDITEIGDYEINIATFTTASVKKGEFYASISVAYKSVSDPEISPVSGEYDTYQSIVISADDDVTIYYTYDGSVPDEYSDIYYDEIEMKRGNYIFSAAALSDDGIWSNVVTRTYNLNIPSQYTEQQAESLVINSLLTSGKIIDTKGTTIDDGKITVDFTENCSVGNVIFIVFTVNYEDKDGVLTETEYYGVNDQTGFVSEMSPTDDGFALY